MRCEGMLSQAVRELEKRLTPSFSIFKSLKAFAPSSVLSQVHRVPYQDLPLPHLRANNESIIEQQYRKIMHISWIEEPIFNGEIPQGSVPFWSGVRNYTKAGGNQPLKELADYALACLTTPTSNAVVERVFSILLNVKTKWRNSLGTEMVDSIIRIRSKLYFSNKCCKDFKITPKMVEKLNSTQLYSTRITSDVEPSSSHQIEEEEEEEDNLLEEIFSSM